MNFFFDFIKILVRRKLHLLFSVFNLFSVTYYFYADMKINAQKMHLSQPFYHQNMQLMYKSTSILNMSYDECARIAPDLVFKNINEIEISADQLFKRVGDDVIVSFNKIFNI